MSTITRERLEELAAGQSGLNLRIATHEESQELARIALASLEAEPVAWDHEWASCITCDGPQNFKRIIEHEAPPEWAIHDGQARNLIPLYSSPPVPDAYIRDEHRRMMLNGKCEPKIGFADGWNACRAAMLLGTTPCTK